MRRVFIAALASLLLWSQAAECSARQADARAPKRDADALAAALRLASGLESGLTKDSELSYLLRDYAKAGRFEEAERTVSLMDDGGLKASALCLLADHVAEAGKLDKAAELLNESLLMIRRASEDGFDSSFKHTLRSIVVGMEGWDYETFPPRGVTTKGTLARLFEAGRTEEAAKVLSQVKSIMLDFEVDDDTQAKLFSNAARLYTQAGDAAKAEEALADASAAARRIEDGYHEVPALCEVAGAYVFAGDRRRAESLLVEATQIALPLELDRDRVLRMIVSAYADAGLHERAREAAGMLSDEEGARAFATLNALGHESKPEEFEAALSGAVAAAASIEEDGEKARALEGLTSAYGARSPGVLSKVAEAASSLRGADSRAEALISVGDKHSEAGRKDTGLEVWRQALASARAVRLERSDLNKGESRINDREKLDLLFTLAQRFARAGSYELAREIAHDVEEVHTRALQLAEGKPAYVTGPGPRLAELALVLLRAGRRSDALEVFEVASRVASADGNEYTRVDSLGAVAAAYAKAGEQERAELHFRRALEATQEIDFYSDSDALGVLHNVGSHYAEAGMKPDARYLKAVRRLIRRVEKEVK